MALFSIKGEGLELIKGKPFKTEKEIQTLTEDNLETVFGLQFVRNEFAINNFRIDTLAFDRETKSFVIIEYKKNKSYSVIDQGFTYLSLLLNNKADFILEYNENVTELLKKKDVDWSQSRVIFVAPNFTSYQRESINFNDLAFELWEIKRFKNNSVLYEKLKPSKTSESIKTISKKDSTISTVTDEVKVYTLEKLLEVASPDVKEAFFTIKDEIDQIDGGIQEKIKKSMVCYYSGGKGLVWIEIKKKGLYFHLRKGKYKDELKKIEKDGWGGYPTLHLKENELDLAHIKYLKNILNQAYNN